MLSAEMGNQHMASRAGPILARQLRQRDLQERMAGWCGAGAECDRALRLCVGLGPEPQLKLPDRWVHVHLRLSNHLSRSVHSLQLVANQKGGAHARLSFLSASSPFENQIL